MCSPFNSSWMDLVVERGRSEVISAPTGNALNYPGHRVASLTYFYDQETMVVVLIVTLLRARELLLND